MYDVSELASSIISQPALSTGVLHSCQCFQAWKFDRHNHVLDARTLLNIYQGTIIHECRTKLVHPPACLRFRQGWKLVGMKMITAGRPLVERHYEEHVGKVSDVGGIVMMLSSSEAPVVPLSMVF